MGRAGERGTEDPRPVGTFAGASAEDRGQKAEDKGISNIEQGILNFEVEL